MNQSSLLQMLPAIMPRAIAWAEAQAAAIEAAGTPLTHEVAALAQRVGVQYPERVRVMGVAQIPLPDDPILAQAGRESGLFGPNIVGLTLGYGIYLQHRFLADPRLLAHECRHVQQYEVAGSIRQFLPIYLHQILTVGYDNAPAEIDARNHEHFGTQRLK